MAGAERTPVMGRNRPKIDLNQCKCYVTCYCDCYYYVHCDANLEKTTK